MDSYGDLLNKLADSFGKDYNQIQSEDIQAYLYENNIPLSSLNEIFRYITQNETYLPRRRKQWEKILSSLFKFRTSDIKDDIRKQLPIYQLEMAKDWTAEKIVNTCKWIRTKQTKMWESGITANNMESKYISFMAIWDRLNDVYEEMREIAKDRIVANGEKELYTASKADLEDIKIKRKPVNVEKKFKDKIVNEIPF